MSVLRIDSPSESRDLSRDELAALGDPVPVRAVVGLLPDDAAVTHATFHASDGYAASIPIGQAIADGAIEVPSEESGRVGVRLTVSEGHTTCLNVKSVVRLELTRGPGKHTIDPNPHTPARVPGWDVER